MGRRKRHSPEQIVRKLEDADRRLNAGRSIAQDERGAAGFGRKNPATLPAALLARTQSD
jgi:hypothetical protein